MRNRTVSLAAVIFTLLVVLAIPSFAANEKPNSPQLKTPGTSQETAPGVTGKLITKDKLADGLKAKHEELFRRPLFARETPFWPFAQGPTYGHVPMDMLASGDVLQLTVGSFDTRGAGFSLPPELAVLDSDPAPGQARHYLIQFMQSATDPEALPKALKSIEDTGARLLEYVPNNGYIVRADAGSLPLLRASSWLQYVRPFHPAYKIDPSIGTYKFLDPARAASDDYTVVVSTFEGEKQAVTDAILAMGGRLLPNQQNSAEIYADVKGPQIFLLAQLEGVRQIGEYAPGIPHSEEGQLIVLNGFYAVDTVSSYHNQKVTGAGLYMFDPSGATDYNGNGKIDSAAQIVHVLDSGLSVDAGEFAETSADAGVTGQTTDTSEICFSGQTVSGTSCTGTNRHRKMAGYISVAKTGGGGQGDLKSCDSGGSGSFTHGQVVSSGAAGGASDVPQAGCANWRGDTCDNPADWDGDGTLESYGAGFFLTSGTQQYRADGVAKGARVYMEDGNNGCPDAGIYAGNLETDLNYAHVTGGARLHNFSFGIASTAPAYGTGAQQIDRFLINHPESMVFLSAGNEGDDNGDSDPFGQPNTLGIEAQAKNALTVGGNYFNFPLALWGTSSIGPAGTGGTRVKPDLLAPAVDFGGTGLAAEYACRSDEDDNLATTDIRCLQTAGASGTSFASPNAMGAGAIVRDYFAIGMYPDATVENASNSSDMAPRISGALVKAILIASTDGIAGDDLGTVNARYEYRFNPEVGYGALNLSNALPLTDDPNTPYGMIVHDTQPSSSPNVRTLSLLNGLTQGQRSCANFDVLANNEPLNIVLAWTDDNGDNTPASALESDLTLEVIDPGDGTAGHEIRYYGNVFTEDFNDDNVIDGNCDINGDNSGVESCDFDNDGSNQRELRSLGLCKNCGDIDGDGTNNSLATMPAGGLCDENANGSIASGECNMKPIDLANVTEAVMLVPDPEGDGTGLGRNADNQIHVARWQVCVNRLNSAATNLQHYALVITGPVSQQSSVRLDTNPLTCNGDIALSVSELGTPTDPNDPCCVDASNCPVDTCVEPRTSIEVRNAAFLTNGLDDDGDGNADETGEDLVDKEDAGTGFQMLQPNAASLVFESDVRIPASSAILDAGLPGTTQFNDGILAIREGYSITAFYNDVSDPDGTGPGSPVTNARRSNSTTDCQASWDLVALGQVGRNWPFLMTGGCDDDKYFDRGEAFGYQVQVSNLEGVVLRNATVSLRARKPIWGDGFDNDSDGTVDENDGTEAAADPCRKACGASCDYTGLRISPSEVNLGQFNEVMLDIYLPVKNVAFAIDVLDNASNIFPNQVEMVVGMRSEASGRTDETCKVFYHLVDADADGFIYSTDYPTGATVDRDYNGDEKISNPIDDPTNPYPNGFSRNNYDKLYETITYANMTTTAYGGGNSGFDGPWDFDTSNNGFRSGIYGSSTNGGTQITNWGEDQNFSGTLDGKKRCDSATNPKECNIDADCGGTVKCRFTEDLDGDGDGTLDQNWGTLGGCGWASANGTAKGIWHTGTIKAETPNTCAGTDDTASIQCEYLDVYPGSAGTQEQWWEFLVSPVINKVHKRSDGQLCADTKDNDGDGACQGQVDKKCLVSADCVPAATCMRVNEDDNNDGTCDEGFAYRVEAWDWHWDQNSDYEGWAFLQTWEIDMDTTNLDPVDISDGGILAFSNNGFGPINGNNVNLTNGWPIFVQNDRADNSPPVGQANGVSPAGTAPRAEGNRTSDRSCMFDSITFNRAGYAHRLRAPAPVDDDCDNDTGLGPDGKPGYAGVDDDGNGVIDDEGEACPCYRAADAQDDDGDTMTDEAQELQRYWSCSTAPATKCRVSGDCPGGSCNMYGAPAPFGDDVCGDGTIDEYVTADFARSTRQSELGNRLQPNGNADQGLINGPYSPLRFGTLEDAYATESGESFQTGMGALTWDTDASANYNNTYGIGLDNMAFMWTETHPINQATDSKCLVGAPPAPPAAGGDGLPGSPTKDPNNPEFFGTQPQCAAVSMGTDLLFEPSANIPVQVVDVNAATTQGNFSCVKYGYAGVSNDCDADGLKEVEVATISLEEPEGETFRLEQIASGSDTYRGVIPVSSIFNGRNDGIMFAQWRNTVMPQFTVRYVDKNDGVNVVSLGADGKPGLPKVDDDFDSRGDDKKYGISGYDDDGTGVCDMKAYNAGSTCQVDGDCTGSGSCFKIDDWREGCRDVDGTAGWDHAAYGDDICDPIDSDADGTTDKGVDEADELCPAGRVTTYSDDTCGCKVNPIESTIFSDFQSANLSVVSYLLRDPSGAEGDGDGWADDRERLTMKVTVRNMGELDLENVNLYLNTRELPATVACITDPRAIVTENGGVMDPGAFVSPADSFEFVMGTPGRTTLAQEKKAAFQITATGKVVDTQGNRSDFYGTLQPLTFSMDLDLDASVANINALKATDKKTFIFNQTASAACSRGDCYTTATFYQNWIASAFPNRPGLHCAYNDPTNPNASTAPANCFLTQDTGVLTVDNDRDGTSDPGSTDWHLHRSQSRGGGHRGHSTSETTNDAAEGCVHMGFHDRNGAVNPNENSGGTGTNVNYNPQIGQDFDTTHLNNIFSLYYKTPFRIGLGRGDYDGTAGIDEARPTVSFWQEMSLPDDRMFTGMYPPDSFEAGVVMALLDRDDDGTMEVGSPGDPAKDGFWKRLNPYYSVPTQQVQAFGNCRYDPDDDGNTEKDLFTGETNIGPSSTCYPEIVWACVGDTQSPPFQTAFFQNPAGDHAYPEGRLVGNHSGVDENGDGTSETGIPGCANKDCEGHGTWLEAKFDLSEFRGRSIWIRFLTAHGQFGGRTWIALFGGQPTSNNRDDGWYIDDLVLTGLQSTGSTFKVRVDDDTITGATCPAQNCTTPPAPVLGVGTYPTRSNSLDDDADGTIDEPGETQTSGACSDAPGRLVELDASATPYFQCIAGQAEYQFLKDADMNGSYETVIQSFSALDKATDNPLDSAGYQVNVRCSSATACAGSATQTVLSRAACGGAALVSIDIPSDCSITYSVPGGVDIVYGGQDALAQNAGNYSVATYGCLVNNDTDGSESCAGIDPATWSQSGIWFTARTASPAGTYDELNSPARDAGIAASGNDCP